MGKDTGFDKLARGLRKRTLATAKIAARAGMGALRKGASKMDVAAAERMAEELGRLKGLGMKFGQMASYLEGTLPPEAQAALAKLQADSEGMDFDVVAEVVEASLGSSVDALFEGFERTPIAAASIGQVHRAQVDGDTVAVKIQYPGIREALAEDLRSFGAVARMGLAFVPGDGKGVVEELRERIDAECDYVAERENLELFGRILGDVEGASVPSPRVDRCGDRVLTTEFIDGRGFKEFVAEASQDERDEAARIIFDGAFGSLFRHCAFNGDPHPGNYLFADGGVCFLDFGCVRHYDADFMDAWKRLALTVLNDDRKAFKTALVDVGFVARPKRFDWDHQWACMQYLYKPFLTPGFRYTAEYVAESYDILIRDNPNKLRMKMPPEWLFTNRLQWGLNSVLVQIGGVADWPGLWRAAVEAPTTPATES